MKTKSIAVVAVMVMLSISCFGQKGFDKKINQYNSKGQKTGYWIEDWGSGGKRELYYQSGVMHGNFKAYSSKGFLVFFGEHNYGEMSGTWYVFGNYGELSSIFKDFKRVDKVIIDKNGTRLVYKNQCIALSYHDNGVIASEGLLLWDEDPVLDTSREYGEWKFYDDNGNLTKTKVYK